MKRFFLRHPQSRYNAGLTDEFNSDITSKGKNQIDNLINNLPKEIDSSYIGYTSPYIRCLRLAEAICKVTGIKFIVIPEIGESPEQVHKNIQARVHRLEFLNFDWSNLSNGYYDYSNENREIYLERLNKFVQYSNGESRNSVIVSHMTPTIDMLETICDTFVSKIANCSISLVEGNSLIYVNKEF